MTESPILLLESDESVIKDVICSLRLVNLSVLALPSVAETKRAALESRPPLILARLRISSDECAGVNLAKEISGEGMLAGLRVAVLCTSSEKKLIEEYPNLFVSEIGLPVEFPLFTKQVQKILETLHRPAQSERPPREAPEKVVEPAPLSTDQLRARNMLAAYEIQLRVLDELKQDERLSKIDPDQMAEVVECVTRQVCSWITAKKFVM